MARAGLRVPALVVLGACVLGIALALPLHDASRVEPPLAHPAWVVGNLTFPYGNVTGEGSDGFPTYTGNNEAEACPAPLAFKCDKCHHGRCDKPVVKNISDHRPCVGRYACHHMPWSESDAVATSAAQAKASADFMRSMTRREVMERALSWVASGYEYKWYRSPESLAERPTTQLEGCARNMSYTCPVERYLADCSGYVGMAWRTLLPCPPPDYFLLPTVATTIACRDLQPGDAVVSQDHVQVCGVRSQSHSSCLTLHTAHCTSKPLCVTVTRLQLFRRWNNETSLEYMAWQMGGNWGKANQVEAVIATQKCSRRLHLV